jgi:hypothetical protein
MKFLLLLIALSLPLSVTSGDQSYLTCEDYEWILEGVEKSKMEESVKTELRLEVKLATDPVCFES